ncbi:MAG: TIGR02678 family protein [Sedimentibacter sp.]
MKELVYLLENKWIIREKDKDLYYSIKDNIKDFRDFIKDKLGYQLVITSDFIKLEKIPGKAEPWMRVEDFDSKIEYALLCLVLMFLEDKEKGEQFVLSQLTDYIQTQWPEKDNPIDWTKYDLRKRFIRVLKYCSKIYLIKANDGNEMFFADSLDAEVLYENIGMSKYLVNRFWDDISEFTSYKDFEDNEYNRFDEDKGIIRKNRVYRSLILSPVVYKYNGYENDLIYIKNYRSMLENDISKYLEGNLHIHKDSAMIILPSGSYKDVFPNNKNISDIILQISYLIRSEYEDINGKIDIPREVFHNLISKCKELYSEGWGKNFREMSLNKLIEEVIFEMRDYQMIEVNDKDERIIILPLAGKIIGKYPKDYKKRGEDDVEMENE